MAGNIQNSMPTNRISGIQGKPAGISEEGFELFKRWKTSNDIQSLKKLFLMYQDPIYRTAKRNVGAEQAEDVLQNIFIQIIHKKVSLPQHESSFLPWILAVTINHCRVQIRSKQRRTKYERNVTNRNEKREEDSKTNTKDETAAAVKEVLSSMPDKYRLPVELRYLEGLTVQETALVLKLKPNTAHYRIKHSLEQLGKQLRKLGVAVSASQGIVILENMVQEPCPVSFTLIDLDLPSTDDSMSAETPEENNSSLSFVMVGTLSAVALAIVFWQGFNAEDPESKKTSGTEAIVESPEEIVIEKPKKELTPAQDVDDTLFDKSWDFSNGNHEDFVCLQGLWKWAPQLKAMVGGTWDEKSNGIVLLPIKPRKKPIQIDLTMLTKPLTKNSATNIFWSKQGQREKINFYKLKSNKITLQYGINDKLLVKYYFIGRYTIVVGPQKILKIMEYKEPYPTNELTMVVNKMVIQKFRIRELSEKELPFTEDEISKKVRDMLRIN